MIQAHALRAAKPLLKVASPLTFIAACLLAPAAFAADPFDGGVPGSALLGHRCEDPLNSCDIAPIQLIRQEKQSFLDKAPARKEKVLNEITRWQNVSAQLKQLSALGLSPGSRFKELYLETAAKVDAIAADKTVTDKVQADADIYASNGEFMATLDSLDTLVSGWKGTIAEIKSYNELLGKVQSFSTQAGGIASSYAGDMNHAVVFGDYFWNSDDAPVNPVRKLQVNIKSYLIMTCAIYTSITPSFYIVGLEAHQTTLKDGAEGLTLVDDAKILQKMLDGTAAASHPMEYRCPINNRSDGPNKAALWFDSGKNLLVDDMTEHDPGFFEIGVSTWYSPAAQDAEVMTLIRQVYAN